MLHCRASSCVPPCVHGPVQQFALQAVLYVVSRLLRFKYNSALLAPSCTNPRTARRCTAILSGTRVIGSRPLFVWCMSSLLQCKEEKCALVLPVTYETFSFVDRSHIIRWLFYILRSMASVHAGGEALSYLLLVCMCVHVCTWMYIAQDFLHCVCIYFGMAPAAVYCESSQELATSGSG